MPGTLRHPSSNGSRSVEASVISGFTIDGNNSSRGVYGVGVDPNIENCVIKSCLGPYDGGAIFFEHCAPIINNNVFNNNVTPISGGAVFIRLGIEYGTAVISNNVFYENIITGNAPYPSGGGIYNFSTAPEVVIENNIFLDNYPDAANGILSPFQYNCYCLDSVTWLLNGGRWKRLRQPRLSSLRRSAPTA